MSGTKVVKSDKKMNYNFLLKCMVGLTAAAVLTAGAIAITAKASATTATVGLAATATAVSGPFALAALIGLSALVAAACVLPFCFIGNRSTVYTTPTSTYYSRPWGWGLFAPAYGPFHDRGPVHAHGGSIFGSGRVHTHGSSVSSGPVHAHGGSIFSSGTTHSHSSGPTHAHGATVHTHGGFHR